MANDARVNFFGNLVRDPELKKVGESTVCSFTVAVKTDYKKDKNQENYDSNFYDCSLWGDGPAKYFMDIAQKGTYVWVDGSFCQAEYVGADKSIKHRMRVKVDNWKGLLRTKQKAEAHAAQPEAVPAAEEDSPF